MMKNFLNSLENAKMHLLAPNYWILQKLGFILPDSNLGRSVYIIMHELVTIFVITQYMELYVTIRTSDLDDVLLNLKISMVSIVSIVKSNNFFINQRKWKELIEYVTEADKFERDNQDEIRGKILDSYTKYCRKITYFHWCLCITTTTVLCVTPLFIFLSSATFREGYRNGTELFPHISSSWTPFDKYHSPGSWILVVIHFLTYTCGGFIMAAYDTCAIVLMVFFGGKLQLLRVRCKQMLGHGGVGISDEESRKVVKELHTIHVQLTKYLKLFNSLNSPVMFLYVVTVSLMLCATAYQLTNASSVTQKVTMAQFLLFGISQLFLFCWHSNIVLSMSQELAYGLYESEWWAATIPQRKAVILLGGQFRINHKFTAGPFTDLTVPTFVTILKGAYSYYAMLRN